MFGKAKTRIKSLCQMFCVGHMFCQMFCFTRDLEERDIKDITQDDVHKRIWNPVEYLRLNFFCKIG